MIEVLRPAKEKLEFLPRRAPVLGKTGKPVKYLSIHFDVTPLKEAEERLKAAKRTKGKEGR